ncbi:hypothetical protein K3X41_09925 [Aliiroseovarius crassostreae]|uniref:hypothetical protein n=1 Tax=Aliiroseovarius crassostreae TaxID=154981 RepID=UPI0021FAD545|nr:hypothetical protein [Aliiroseovarius crassostreae]UWQ10237.1 hypothetical protein K3X41_09925 [Aliiroseovarius crassostreae]
MTDNPETYGGANIPKSVRKAPKDLLTIGQIADVVTPTGVDKKKRTDLLRWYRAQGYLTAVARETEGRQSYLYLPDMILLAEILFRMGEFGISSKDAAQAARLAISQWNEADFEGDAPALTPGMHVIRDYEAGQRDWTFELWSFVHPKNGRVAFQGRIAANQRGQGTVLLKTQNSPYEVRAVFAVDLIDVLDRVHPMAKARREAMN